MRRLLERDLSEQAEDTSLRLIWADLVQLDGDPLGRLVVLDHVGEGRNAAAERARAEAQELRAQLHARLWDTDLTTIPGVALTWRLGFVSELDIHIAKLPSELGPARPQPRARRGRRPAPRTAIDSLDWLMPVALRQFALRWLEVIRIHYADANSRACSGWLGGSVHSATLREIHIGHPPRVRARPAGAWESNSSHSWLRESDRLISQFPRLCRLSYGGELIRLPCCAGPSQTRMHFIERLTKQPLTSSTRAALARALWDSSNLVHEQAFAAVQTLGARALFLLEELGWFLRSPISKKDPRPAHALRCLTAIGPGSAPLLREVLSDPQPLTEIHARREALMNWLAVLGPAAKPAAPLIDAVLAPTTDERRPPPKSLRDAAKRARKRLDS